MSEQLQVRKAAEYYDLEDGVLRVSVEINTIELSYTIHSHEMETEFSFKNQTIDDGCAIFITKLLVKACEFAESRLKEIKDQ